MTKAVRFPRKLEVWVPEIIAQGFEALAADQLLSVSDHMRQALALYLRQFGAMPPQAPRSPNGRAENRQEMSHV